MGSVQIFIAWSGIKVNLTAQRIVKQNGSGEPRCVVISEPCDDSVRLFTCIGRHHLQDVTGSEDSLRDKTLAVYHANQRQARGVSMAFSLTQKT